MEGETDVCCTVIFVCLLFIYCLCFFVHLSLQPTKLGLRLGWLYQWLCEQKHAVTIVWSICLCILILERNLGKEWKKVGFRGK